MRRALAVFTLLVAHVEAKPIVNVCSLFPKWTLDGSEPWGTGSGKARAFDGSGNITGGAAIHQQRRHAPTQHHSPINTRRLTLRSAGGDGRVDAVGSTRAAKCRLRCHHRRRVQLRLKGVATVSSLVQTPQISYSSTSPDLSDSAAYPYLMRVAVSDTLQSTALAGLVRHLLGFNRVATIASTDLYGRTGIEAFHQKAAAEEIDVLEAVSFDKGTSEAVLRAPGGPIERVRASGVRAIVLFCQEADARRVISASRASGIGGQNYTWIGSETVSQLGASFFDSFEAGTLGYVGIEPAPAATTAHATYEAMAVSLPSHAGNGSNPTDWHGGCDIERDDSGELLWAIDDGNGQPYRCGGVASQAGDTYGPYVYDAAYTAAHALHKLIEVDGVGSSFTGTDLYNALLETTFEGATGNVSFDQSFAGQRFRGDRLGVRYNILNYNPPSAGGSNSSLATLGSWSFVSSDAGWADSFVAAPSAPPIMWATADGSSRPPVHATDGFVRIGLACVNASGVASYSDHELCDRFRHGITLLNNKSDGFFDDLLPNVSIVSEAATVGCIDGLARTAYASIDANLPGVSAYIGPSCSTDVELVADRTWRATSGTEQVIIAADSTSTGLSDPTTYTKLIRATPNEMGRRGPRCVVHALRMDAHCRRV